jgi:TolB-like protein/class 3 adenylate cyclase/Tfp pilus assembly protein PilF
MAEARVQRRLTAVLATDVVAFSRLVGIDEEGTLAALSAHRREFIEPNVEQHHGRIVKTSGDGALIEFASAVDAVRFAVEMQRGMAERNAGVPSDKRIEFRIGINVGDIVIDGDDILGDGVNIAARLEGLAEPGGVLVSRAVRDQVRDRLQLDFVDLGERALKNIARPVRVYGVHALVDPNEASSVRKVLPLPDKPSIAVLPFQNMSGDAEHEFFADGIAEEIITGLSRLRWLFVIARNSSFTYKGRNVDVRQVGRELGVRYVLQGSVRRSGNRIRVTGQLVEAETGTQLWAERYDRALDDVFEIQDEIAEIAIGCIQPELYAAEHDRLKRKPPRSLDAWERFVHGMFLYSQHSDAGTKQALDELARAIELDDSYAKAHGLRAVCLAWRAYQGWEDWHTAFAAAAAGASRAVVGDPQEPWAYVALGFVAQSEQRNADAVGAFSRAIDVSPNFAYAHGLLGAAHSAGGRPEQAIECIDRAIRLSPRDIFGDEYQLYYAFAHFQAGRYAEAASAAQRAIDQRPDHPVLYVMAVASYGLAGETATARRLATQLMRLVPSFSVLNFEERFFYCQQTDRSRLAAGLRAAGLPG